MPLFGPATRQFVSRGSPVPPAPSCMVPQASKTLHRLTLANGTADAQHGEPKALSRCSISIAISSTPRSSNINSAAQTKAATSPSNVQPPPPSAISPFTSEKFQSIVRTSRPSCAPRVSLLVRSVCLHPGSHKLANLLHHIRHLKAQRRLSAETSRGPAYATAHTYAQANPNAVEARRAAAMVHASEAQEKPKFDALVNHFKMHSARAATQATGANGPQAPGSQGVLSSP
ncbi:hypothetical protein BKA70DRAFT_1541210 [Coprinopsis sp. MPI-PUGE-AT-0042]|nr:hypothetical protein BKA70DRAFT_1541210 [Coprinopsis sp. MPI-PUGE-AT-0042]